MAEKKTNKLPKPVLGYFKKIELAPYKLIKEVESTKEGEPKKEIGLLVKSRVRHNDIVYKL